LTLTGRDLRLAEFLRPEDHRTLIVEMDRGLMLGPVQGLVRLGEALERVKGADAVVLTLGQVKRVYGKLKGRTAPVPIIRADWTNMLRGEGHALPALDVKHVMVAEAEDIALSGAAAGAAFFLVGYDRDRDEAENMEEVARLARGCARLSIPLLVQAIPFGPRITRENLFDCISMAARMALEAGADVVAAPYPGSPKLLGELVESVRVPFLLWDRGYEAEKLEALCKEAVDAGAAGMMVGEGLFTSPDWPERLKTLEGLIHK
jgi:DhnA family fructose-bisphosphate aldolase class Ia